MECHPLMDTSGILLSEVEHWRSEAQELKARLKLNEQMFEERLREMRQGFDRERDCIKEAAAQGAKVAFLHTANQEVERLSRASKDAQDWARKSDERVMLLLAESQQAARLMDQVKVKFERQVEVSTSLKGQLHQSEVETQQLRADLESALQREAEKGKRHDCAEATIACIMPRLTEETKVEMRMAEEAQDAKQRLKRAESMFNAQAHELVSELNQSREQHLALGRRCAETAEVANLHANAGYQWQQRSRAAEQELVRSGLNQHHLYEAARHTRAEHWKQEERLRMAEEQRDRAMYSHVVADQARRDMTNWVVSSLDEVNRSAHVRTSEAPRDAEENFKGHAWVDMLESFRKDQQSRSGFGARTHGPV